MKPYNQESKWRIIKAEHKEIQSLTSRKENDNYLESGQAIYPLLLSFYLV